LDVPGGFNTQAYGINSLGEVVGYYSGGVFLYSGGSYATLSGMPPSPFAQGLNARHQVVGTYLVHDGANGFLWGGGSYTTIGLGGGSAALGINDAGQVVGQSGTVGWLLSEGRYTVLRVPGSFTTSAAGINNAGQIVGSTVVGGQGFGFLLSGGVYTTFQVPGASVTYAQGINDRGQIAGYYSDSAGNGHGFVLSDGVYAALDVPGATGTGAFGINDAGQLVGDYGDARGGHGFLATPVPEPGGLVLLGIGTLAVIGYGWRAWRRTS
jgi:uncharacterized membrane protein